MGNRIAGYLTVSIGGELFTCAGDFEVNPSNIAGREALTNTDGTVAGYNETYQAPKFNGQIRYKSDFDLDGFMALTDTDAQLTLANGDVWLFKDGWVELNSGIRNNDSTADFTFYAKTSARTSAGS